MDKATLLALAERVESAQAEQQAALFEEAVRALSDARLISAACAVRCAILIDVRAFLDAAAALVPEGRDWWVRLYNSKPHAAVEHHEPWSWADIACKAATPALALCAAALRARAAMMEE